MKNLFLLFFLFIAFESKSQIETKFNKCTMQPSEVILPDTILLGDTIEYQIEFNLPDGCTYLAGIDIMDLGNELKHEMYSNCPPPNQRCTDILKTATVDKKYFPKQIGTYYFTFYRGERLVKKKKVVVINVD